MNSINSTISHTLESTSISSEDAAAPNPGAIEDPWEAEMAKQLRREGEGSIPVHPTTGGGRSRAVNSVDPVVALLLTWREADALAREALNRYSDAEEVFNRQFKGRNGVSANEKRCAPGHKEVAEAEMASDALESEAADLLRELAATAATTFEGVRAKLFLAACRIAANYMPNDQAPCPASIDFIDEDDHLVVAAFHDLNVLMESLSVMQQSEVVALLLPTRA